MFSTTNTPCVNAQNVHQPIYLLLVCYGTGATRYYKRICFRKYSMSSLHHSRCWNLSCSSASACVSFASAMSAYLYVRCHSLWLDLHASIENPPQPLSFLNNSWLYSILCLSSLHLVTGVERSCCGRGSEEDLFVTGSWSASEGITPH